MFVFSYHIIVSLLLYTSIHFIFTKYFFYLSVVNFPLEEYYIIIPPFMKDKKFPQDIQCIVQPVNGLGAIYISNIEAAENPNTLKRLGIQAVITAIKGKNLDSVIPKHIEYMYIPAVDHESFDISYYFQQSNNFIQEERKRTNVLVHCMAGISRSVALVIAYLMNNFQKSFNQAYNYVKLKRNIIHPNDSFIKQLKNYQNKIKKSIEKMDKSGLVSSALQNLQKKINQTEKMTKFQKHVGKIRFTHEPRQLNQKQNDVCQTYDEILKSSIREIFKKNQRNHGRSELGGKIL